MFSWLHRKVLQMNVDSSGLNNSVSTWWFGIPRGKFFTGPEFKGSQSGEKATVVILSNHRHVLIVDACIRNNNCFLSIPIQNAQTNLQQTTVSLSPFLSFSPSLFLSLSLSLSLTHSLTHSLCVSLTCSLSSPIGLSHLDAVCPLVWHRHAVRGKRRTKIDTRSRASVCREPPGQSGPEVSISQPAPSSTTDADQLTSIKESRCFF